MKLFEFLWVRNGKIYNFWAKPAHWYLYRKWVLVPIRQRQSGSGTDQSGTGTGTSSNPVFVPLALFSLVFVHRLFRDPNKGLMGLHIRVYKRENIPYLAPLAKRYLFSMIICLTTKSGEFLFY